MKQAVIFVIFLAIGLLAITAGFHFFKSSSFSWWSAQLSGMETIKSSQYQIEASGFDLRAYSFIDSHGRYCTTVFASSSGAGIDCDFKTKE